MAADIVMPAASKLSVKLRKLLKLENVGVAAPALIFLSVTSRILAVVPPNTNAAIPILLAWVPSKISDAGAVTATVVVPPVAVSAPVSLIVPPAVNDKFCPMLDVPRANAPLLITLTLFAPELLSDTAPVKAFDCVKVIGFALALKLEIPGTVNAPVCVIAPEEVIVTF